MDHSRIRAPYAVLRELLGEPDELHGMDKTSTCFRNVFEGTDVYVYDFHKEEWGDRPPCLTDSSYVWEVDGANVDAFCQWLSDEIVKRMRSATGGRSLDHADRARVNEMLAAGVSLGDAMKRVKMVVAGSSDQYRWPLADEDKPNPERAATLRPAAGARPSGAPAGPKVRRKGVKR